MAPLKFFTVQFAISANSPVLVKSDSTGKQQNLIGDWN